MPPAHFQHQPKTPFERLRTKLTMAVFPLWAALLIGTRADGFETFAYKIIEYVGFTLICVAVIGRIWCSLYISGKKDQELCTVGPYSLSRNPLYFFSFLGVVGICFAAQNLTLTIISSSVFLAYYHFIIRSEERRLYEMFGADFDGYMKSVPRFLPRVAAPTINARLSVNVSAFTRSLTEVFWFLMAFVVLEILEDLRRNGFIANWILSY